MAYRLEIITWMDTENKRAKIQHVVSSVSTWVY